MSMSQIYNRKINRTFHVTAGRLRYKIFPSQVSVTILHSLYFCVRSTRSLCPRRPGWRPGTSSWASAGGRWRAGLTRRSSTPSSGPATPSSSPSGGGLSSTRGRSVVATLLSSPGRTEARPGPETGTESSSRTEPELPAMPRTSPRSSCLNCWGTQRQVCLNRYEIIIMSSLVQWADRCTSLE